MKKKKLVIGMAIVVIVIIAVVLAVSSANSRSTGSNSTDKALIKPINAFQRIPIESFNEREGVIVEDCSEDNSQSIGGVRDGHYTAYYNVDFGEEGAYKAVFRAAAMMAGGDIEIRLDGIDGELIGTCKVATTGPNWETWVNAGCDILPTTGVHDVYLIYRGEDYLFNINWFRFAKDNGKGMRSVALSNYSPRVGDQMTATISPANAIVSYEWLVEEEVVSIAEHYIIQPRDMGKTLQVRLKGLGYTTGELVSEATRQILSVDYEFNVEEAAYESFSSFIDEYYYSKMNKFGLFLGTEFWDQAEIYEIVIDAYENTGDPRYRDMIYDIFRGFKLHNGENWAHNEYNDDIMWMVIACSRAYLLTGDPVFAEIARSHFDLVWDRGWSDDLGGGIWWRTDNQTKNSCINGPAVIAACLLAEALGEDAYYDKAVQIMDWQAEHLYDAASGQVYDAYDIHGSKNHWASTYNQGTFIGANMLLYEHTRDELYYNRARLAADYTINTMYQGGVMNNEDSSGDLIGFKGILCRWIYRFAVRYNQTDILEWLKYNGAVAWNNRNKAGLIWTTWNAKTSDKVKYDVFGASSAVSLLNNSRTKTSAMLDGSQRIEIEAFDTCKGIVTKECSEGGKSVAGIRNNDYTVYYNVDFKEGGFTKASFRAASARQGGTIEIRLGGVDGKILGSCEINTTGGWDVWETFTCDVTDVSGIQELYLVYKGSDDDLFNLNWFELVR